jgi:hypothetical protein
VLDFIETRCLLAGRAKKPSPKRIKQLALIWPACPQSYPQERWKAVFDV